jgi:RNA polymerase sigma factor (TIGR02999 family)
VSPDKPNDVTMLLRAWSAGDRSVESRLFELVLPDLRRLAHYLMKGERPDHSLQSTALMNEAYMRLVSARDRDWENRRHFFAVAARAMRHLLIDHARARGKGVKTPLAGLEEILRGRDAQLDLGIAINGLLDELDKTHHEWCSIVEMKFFAGFTDEEVAEALGTPLRSMQRKFGDARRWLFEKLESQPWQGNTNATPS